ncbi:YraN family protein [Pedobacter sp. P351]|uniref:YraN family protein n=1 Tax=Pedobacter superstes TaxID=3133441 RepID=UPI0030A93CCC
MATHNLLGQQGEVIARKFLEEIAYEILDENWCFGKAEIDLIAYRDKRIVFVEVKTRSSTGFGQPEDFVNESKQRLLQKAAEEYLYLMNFKGEIRFDIISILFQKNGEYTLKHIEDAFW